MKALLVLALFIVTKLHAETVTGYVCFSTGLNMRDKPSLQGKIIGKVPYATKLTYDDAKKDTIKVVVENMTGYWVPVTYQNKKGYVLDCYLISIKPPKKGTASMEDYLKQITTVAGPAVKVINGDPKNLDITGFTKTVQLYKNTASWHNYLSYEYTSDSYFLPELTTQEVFLIIRQLADFESVLTEKDALPIKNETKKTTDGDTKTTQIELDDWREEKYIKRLVIKKGERGSERFIIELLDTQEVMVSHCFSYYNM